MEADFWHEKWEKGAIGFHQSDVNEFLISHWQQALPIEKTSEILVPLCGKTYDMFWLREQGHSILGEELNSAAVASFFSENGLDAQKTEATNLTGLSCEEIRVLAGDFFQLTREDCANIKAVYDRAALVALPTEMRRKYVNHLIQILPAGTPFLLVTMEYEQSEMTGPPFSVTEQEVISLYKNYYQIKKLEQKVIDMKGVSITEKVFLLNTI